MKRATATIIVDDAERLVRDGGVHNASDYLASVPLGLVDARSAAPFDAVLFGRLPNGNVQRRGKARVVDVHHADDCEDYAEKVGMPEYADPANRYCDPDAQPGMWHWVMEGEA